MSSTDAFSIDSVIIVPAMCRDMVKQSVLLMGNFFTRERFGKPQILAALMLLVFLAECGWLIAHEAPGPISAQEYSRCVGSICLRQTAGLD